MKRIRAGIGGWVYPPWRGSFYPPGLKQADELGYASRQLTAIEINGTFYGAQTPATFRRWRAAVPEGFVFSVKGPRFATHRRDLAAAAPAVERFFASGVLELGAALGPILWQFPPTARFEAANLAAFCAQLPREAGGRPIRHVVEARHPSFAEAACSALLARHGIARALVDAKDDDAKDNDAKDGAVPDCEPTADFVYLRLKGAVEAEPAGYAAPALAHWAARARSWAARRDCFVYFIDGAKIRAPAAARAFIALIAE